MSAPAENPAPARWRRPVLITAWAALAMTYLLELGWYVRGNYDVFRFNRSILPVTATARESAHGSMLVCWSVRDAKVAFVVLEGPFSTPQGAFVGGERVWFDPPLTRLQVSRTESVPAECDPPRLFHFREGRLESAPLPAGFSERDLEDFLATPAVLDGAAGFARWTANPVRPAERPRAPTVQRMPNVRRF